MIMITLYMCTHAPYDGIIAGMIVLCPEERVISRCVMCSAGVSRIVTLIHQRFILITIHKLCGLCVMGRAIRLCGTRTHTGVYFDAVKQRGAHQ
jgi:hypothetical protein